MEKRKESYFDILNPLLQLQSRRQHQKQGGGGFYFRSRQGSWSKKKYISPMYLSILDGALTPENEGGEHKTCSVYPSGLRCRFERKYIYVGYIHQVKKIGIFFLSGIYHGSLLLNL